MSDYDRILEKLDSLSADLAAVREDVAVIKAMDERDGADLVDLAERVDSLENDRAKVKGALVGATAGGAGLGAGLSKLLGFFSS